MYGLDSEEAMAIINAAMAEKRCELLNVTISGSHLYGFNSENSDVDYRGAYMCAIRDYISLTKPAWCPTSVIVERNGKPDKTNRSGVKGGQIDVVKRDGKGEVIYDVVLFEVEKEARLALKGNCNVIEQMFAPQIYVNPEYEKLKTLVAESFGKKGICNSYRGLAWENYLKFTKQGKKTVKKYLYIMRGLMAGIYVLDTGNVESNIEKLNDMYFNIPEVSYLIQKKKDGKENDSIGILNILSIEKKMESMFDDIDAAYERSKLQEYPTDEQFAKASDMLIEMRMKLSKS